MLQFSDFTYIMAKFANFKSKSMGVKRENCPFANQLVKGNPSLLRLLSLSPPLLNRMLSKSFLLLQETQ